KALELGRPLPEVEIAQAKADEVRARAAAGAAIVRTVFTVIGTLGPLGIAVGATGVILRMADSPLHPLLIVAVWVCSALVALALAAFSLLGAQTVTLPELFRKKLRLRGAVPVARAPDGSLDPAALPPEEAERLSRAIQK